MYLVFKRLFDLSVALVTILLTSPITVLTALALVVANRGTPLFFQARPGKRGKVFRIIKFKTMNDLKGKDGELLPDDVRLTWFGKIVRKLSIDELPQLVNVLRGEMSLVGPRPLLVEYLPLYSTVQMKRHNVRPGITGWAQVNGRNTLSWEKKFEYDVWYVNNVSFGLDLKILFLTALKLIKPQGISSNTSATMEKFKGSQQ